MTEPIPAGRRVASIAGALAMAATALTWALVGPVAAHALLLSSDPPAGATLGSSPTAITMTFGERPDPRLSTVRVLTVSGASIQTGPLEVVPGNPLQLRLSIGPLPDGVYTVTWRTVSAVDGHVAAGTFSFGVGVAPPAPGGGGQATTSDQGPSASPQATAVRLLLYLGLIGLLGASLVALLLGAHRTNGVVRMAVAAWILEAIGTVGLIAVQWLDTGSDLGTILGSSIGVDGIVRVVVVAASGLPVAWLALRRAGDGRIAALLVTVGAAMSLLVDVATGHAAAGSPPIVTIAVQWFHGTAAGIWIGGLAGLLVAIRGRAAGDDSARLVRHFSTAAAFGLVIVAGTGLLRAISEVGTLDALFNTDFGRLIVVKSVLLVGLSGLGAINRFRNVGRAGRTLRPLRLVGGIEVSAGFVVLLVTAVLVNLAPPARAATGGPPSPQPGPIIASGADFGTTLRLRLAVSPGRPGTNRFDVAVTGFDDASPASVDGVSLRFTPASATSVPASTLALQPQGTGAFQGSGANLSLDGIWKLTAVVARQGGGVEVPLVLSTVVPTQQVDVIVSPGAPTIYTLHFDAGRTVQLYLDPGRAGQNDVHATFFDAAGAELPIAKATMAAGPVGSGQTLLTPRLLEPGHFVGQAQATAGKLAVDVVALAPDGNPLHGHLEMDVVP